MGTELSKYVLYARLVQNAQTISTRLLILYRIREYSLF